MSSTSAELKHPLAGYRRQVHVGVPLSGCVVNGVEPETARSGKCRLTMLLGGAFGAGHRHGKARPPDISCSRVTDRVVVLHLFIRLGVLILRDVETARPARGAEHLRQEKNRDAFVDDRVGSTVATH